MNIGKEKGWRIKGKLLCAQKSGKFYKRTNIIAGLRDNKIISPAVFNGPCNGEFFEQWVDQFLIKELKLGQVVIMNNASFHKSIKIKELIESVGCKIFTTLLT